MSAGRIRLAAALAITALALVAVYIFMPREQGTAGLETVTVADVDALATFYGSLSYTLDGVRSEPGSVPDLRVVSLPDGWSKLTQVDRKKRLFLRTLLPMVLIANAEIEADRARLLDLRKRLAAGDSLEATDDTWLRGMLDDYAAGPGADGSGATTSLTAGDLDELVLRVDSVPTSMALAQGAIESGWGTSRFARDGNALFGQWTFDGGGIDAEDAAPGDDVEVAAFDTLLASVRTYIHNLNTERAYDAFRTERAKARAAGRLPSGTALAATLTKYSTQGEKYDTEVREVIAQNKLEALDGAALVGDGRAWRIVTP